MSTMRFGEHKYWKGPRPAFCSPVRIGFTACTALVLSLSAYSAWQSNNRPCNCDTTPPASPGGLRVMIKSSRAESGGNLNCGDSGMTSGQNLPHLILQREDSSSEDDPNSGLGIPSGMGNALPPPPPGMQRVESEYYLPEATGLPSDEWRPRIYSRCTDGMPTDWAPCLKHDNMLVGEQVGFLACLFGLFVGWAGCKRQPWVAACCVAAVQYRLRPPAAG